MILHLKEYWTMSRMQLVPLLWVLGMSSCVLLGLAGCGGSSEDKGGGTGGATARNRLTLQLSLPERSETDQPVRGLQAAQARQVQPGAPGFIERLDIRIRAQGRELLPPQSFSLSPAEQETVRRDIEVPTDPTIQTFEVAVAAFNASGVEIFRGEIGVARTQDVAVVTLTRSTLLLAVATPATLRGRTFLFTDGAAFGLPGVAMTLVLITFEGNRGNFTLTSGGFTVRGTVTISSCDFMTVESTFPVGRGPQRGDRFLMDPCEIDTVDGRLSVRNTATGAQSVSAPPANTVEQAVWGSFRWGEARWSQ